MGIKTILLIAVLSLFLSSSFVFAQDNGGGLFVTEISASDANDLITVSFDGEAALVYPFRSVPAKPYVKVLRTPGGVNILRDAPHDHLHHHGLMFALKINETDFWEENKNFGMQVHKSYTIPVWSDSEIWPYDAVFTESIDWVTPSKKTTLQEKRRISLRKFDNFSVLTWSSKLKTPEGVQHVKIGGSHYFGLGMRFVKSMDNNGTFINAAGKAGKIFRGSERLVSAKWCAYQSAVDGKPVTVAMFDHPKNFRPVTWFTMLKPFSYLSATLRYHQKPFVLKAKDELNLTYGVAVWDGKQSKEVIEKAYQKWAKAVEIKKENKSNKNSKNK